MLSQSQIEAIAQAVLQELKQNPSSGHETAGTSMVPDEIGDPSEKESMLDLTSPEAKATPLWHHVEDRELRPETRCLWTSARHFWTVSDYLRWIRPVRIKISF